MNEKINMPEKHSENWAEEAATLKEVLHKINSREGITFPEKMAIQEKISDFGKGLIKKYGVNEIRKYVLFHILGGSSGYEDIVEFFDFYGDDSIKKFIEDLENEQKETGEK